MLVRRGVEDDVGPFPPEDRAHDALIADVGQDLHDVAVVDARGGVEQVGLVPIEDDQALRLERRHLARDLRSDRAAPTGDQDPTALDERSDGFEVGLHLAAPEEVVDRQVPDVADADLAVHQLGDARQDLQR